MYLYRCVCIPGNYPLIDTLLYTCPVGIAHLGSGTMRTSGLGPAKISISSPSPALDLMCFFVVVVVLFFGLKSKQSPRKAKGTR